MIDEWFKAVRNAELDIVFNVLSEEKNDITILEIGSGNGYQLEKFIEKYTYVRGIDISESMHLELDSNVKIYNGRNIPFSDGSFDLIFSSHVMEHILDHNEFQDEIKRVLTDNGKCIHIMPSHIWRILTSSFYYPNILIRIIKLIYKKLFKANDKANDFKRYKNNGYIKYLFPTRHGEKGNIFTEIYYFTPRYWRKLFLQYGWNIIGILPSNIIYYGHDILRLSLSLKIRKYMSKFIGSSSYIYVVNKK